MQLGNVPTGSPRSTYSQPSNTAEKQLASHTCISILRKALSLWNHVPISVSISIPSIWWTMDGTVWVTWPPHGQRVPGSMIDSPVQTVSSWERISQRKWGATTKCAGQEKKKLPNPLHYVLFSIFELKYIVHFRLNHHHRTEQFQSLQSLSKCWMSGVEK